MCYFGGKGDMKVNYCVSESIGMVSKGEKLAITVHFNYDTQKVSYSFLSAAVQFTI